MNTRPTRWQPVDFNPTTYATRTIEYWMLLATRRVLTTTWLLIAFAVLLVGLSLAASLHTDAWHWFQRSGALLVSIGALLSTRRSLAILLDCMLAIRQPGFGLPPTEEASDYSELQTCVCGFLLVATGTLIWSYGDLVGCLLAWDGSCING